MRSLLLLDNKIQARPNAKNTWRFLHKFYEQQGLGGRGHCGARQLGCGQQSGPLLYHLSPP